MDITIIVVTSPAPSNPSTELISQSIESCDLVNGLEGCPVIIVMDGFKVGPVDRTKLGRITEESAARYELYHQALLETFSSSRYRVVRNSIHQGFALSVKVGLELCTTKYCVVSQYDRMFCAPFGRLGDLVKAMEDNVNIRYIGFPTSTNVSHDKFISTNYNLYCLNKPEVKLCLDEHFYLQPAVFWYDSQHLAHVERYLQIYRPYKNMPFHLRDIIGNKSIKNMILRPGDFIEDRFGQMQRRLLWMLATKGKVTHDGGEQPPKREESSELDATCDDSAGYDSKTGGGSKGSSYNAGASDVSLISDRRGRLTLDVGGPIGETGEHGSRNLDNFSRTDPRNVPNNHSSAAKVAAAEVNLDIVVELFRWYGSYLCWINTSPFPYEVHAAQEKSDTQIFVRHLRGRQLNSEGIAWKLGTAVTGNPKGGYWAGVGAGAGAVDPSCDSILLKPAGQENCEL